MNKKLSKFLIIFGGVLVGIYVLFLLLPILTIPFLNSLTSDIAKSVKEQTGFVVNIDKLRVVSTPKLTVGVKIDNIDVVQPDGKNLMTAEKFQAKMSLLPLFLGKIEADVVSADSLNLDLYVKNNGHFLIEDFIPETETASSEEQPENAEAFALPLGLKLSNKLPDFRLKKHNITFIDASNGRKYSLVGENTNVLDFVINKKIKVQSEGKLVLDGFEAFTYDVNVFNKIMPDIDLNELVSAPQEPAQAPQNNEFKFNIIDAFKTIKNNALRANLFADLKFEGSADAPVITGKLTLDKLSMITSGRTLPESNLALEFNKDKVKINSNLYTDKTENTQLKGTVQTGKKTNLDIVCKSNATLKSIFEIANTFAQIAGINDLKTLKANGQLDVNFNIKSDLKKIASNGYLKLMNGAISYGLYNVQIDNIVSDIELDNNTIFINKLGFSTLSVPLSVTGKIKPDATCDIKVQTTSLPIKGLLVSLGQAALLKENPVNSGAITVLINVAGKLFEPKIEGKISVNNLNVKNVPSDVTLSVNPVEINLNTTKTGFTGTILASGLKAVNPAVQVSAPSIKANINEKAIDVLKTVVYVGKNQMNVSGSISNYLANPISLDFLTEGSLNSNLSGSLDASKMTLDLKYKIPQNSTIIIPGFDKSAITARGKLDIVGSMMNPILKGSFTIPKISIPEVPVTINNMTATLNGPILLGNATVGDFVSGGIAAKNIKTDFKMSGVDFYLNNLQGEAFDGSFLGNIIYNMANGKCKVKINGKNMNALQAIEGAAGIKNALTGTLAFGADVNFAGVEYDDMIKSLKGSADFEIKNGVLANLGGLKTFMNAQNLLQNTLLKSSAEKTGTLSVVQKASEFDYIKGKLTFDNAYANLQSITMAGPSMAYYITGKFNILNGTTNAVVLGRLSQSVVGVMGNLGNLAVNKITSAIPGLGTLTSSLVKSMNESPKNVDVSKIPALSSKDAKYRDFKVDFNGGIESKSSVKSFKWINDVDTTELDKASGLGPVSDVKNTVNNQINQTKTQVQNSINDAKAKANQAKEELKQTKDAAKDLFKSFLVVPSSN